MVDMTMLLQLVAWCVRGRLMLRSSEKTSSIKQYQSVELVLNLNILNTRRQNLLLPVNMKMTRQCAHHTNIPLLLQQLSCQVILISDWLKQHNTNL